MNSSHKAYSNQDIEEFIIRDRSSRGDNKTHSDHMIEDDFLYPKRKSEGGTVSPYISDCAEVEKAMSNASIEDSGHYSDVSLVGLTFIELSKI